MLSDPMSDSRFINNIGHVESTECQLYDFIEFWVK